VLQPINLKNEDFIRTYRELDADLAVVVAFRMLPEVIWSAPRLGTINLHASLLPAYRGAAPINWAIINGEKKTGLTTFLIAKEIDTGGVIYQKEIYIDENETAGSLHDRMMDIGAELVVDTVHTMLSEQAKYLEQDDSKATKAPKIFTEDCEIQKEWPARKIYNFIRGLSPFPGAWIQIGSDVVKIVWSTYNQTPLPYNSGTILSDGKSYLRLCTVDGYVDFEELQMPGKKRMNIKAFLNGFDINRWENDVLQIS
ncbi:MAG: methionyl-tRNA formyltransferase, partial [Saprospiraceae bacterium]|nr:methionyl-tRNA formyltransferase [Saprospiraceae bacterium]